MDATPQPLPQDLAGVPEGERIQEAFGWAPSGWAGLFLLLAGLVLMQPAKQTVADTLVMVTSAGLALLLVAHDVRRRKRPRILVRPGYGPLLGIYRSGRLQRTVELARSQVLVKHPSRTWGPIFMLSLATLGSLSFLLPGPIQMTAGDRWLALVAACSFAGLTASILKTRLRCDVCLFPYPGTPGFESILVPRQSIKRIFSHLT